MITDPLVIYESIREDQRAEDNPRRRYTPKSQRVRVLAYSGGFAVLRGEKVIASYTTLTEALLRQMEERS
jgi:ribonuclease HIII